MDESQVGVLVGGLASECDVLSAGDGEYRDSGWEWRGSDDQDKCWEEEEGEEGENGKEAEKYSNVWFHCA